MLAMLTMPILGGCNMASALCEHIGGYCESDFPTIVYTTTIDLSGVQPVMPFEKAGPPPPLR